MTTEKFDVVVIGAGLGGLSAAGHLAKAGKKVLVLEHHAVPGGYAHEFRRGHYRFEVSLHAIEGAAPGGWAYAPLKELGVFDQVRFQRLDPIYTIRFPDREIVAHADIYEYEAELIRHFPEEADGIRSLIDAMYAAAQDTWRFVIDREKGLFTSMLDVPQCYPDMLPAMTVSWEEFMDEHIRNSELKTAISALWGYYGLPPRELNAAAFIIPTVSFHHSGAYYPEGGSMAISRAIENTIKQYGGEIRYRQTVNRIEVRDGLVTAVETEQGLRVETNAVISNANAPATLLKMVGREHFDASYLHAVEDAEENPSISNLVVYLGLDRDLKAEGWEYHEFFVTESYDLDADYEKVKEGAFDQVPLAITLYDHADPTCAPEGGSVLVAMTLATWDYTDQWGTGGNLENYGQNPHYLELKQDAGEKIIDRLEKEIPGLRDSIKYVEVATPLTNHRYTRNTGGGIYGSAQAVDNMYTDRLRMKTPIPNLLLTGAWVAGGGQSIVLRSGQFAAKIIQKYFDGEYAENPMEPEISDEMFAQEEPAESTDDQATSNEVPSSTLTAIGSNRQVALEQIGRPAVLIFHTQETEAAGNAINEAVRAAYPQAEDVAIASVVNLKSVPKPFHAIARSVMKKSYGEASKSLPDGCPPEEYVVILPDWNGAVTKQSGFKATHQTAGIMVLDAAGGLVGCYQGDDPGPAVLEMLKKVI